MSEPLSGGGAVAVTIGGASVFGLLTNTDFGVVVGAFAGALFCCHAAERNPGMANGYSPARRVCGWRSGGLAWLRH